MKRAKTDKYGQPNELAFCARMVTERQIDELIGLCKGVVADGEVNDAEMCFLCEWLERNRRAANRWPGRVLYDRVRRVLQDGVIDSGEQADLVHLLMDVCGGQVIDPEATSMSSTLPLDVSPPPILFESRFFCLTGKFLFGTRRECQQAIAERGGQLQGAPTNKTNYVVIGAIGSRDWMHSTHGRKIERAVEIREAGHAIAIVAEEHWTAHLTASVGS